MRYIKSFNETYNYSEENGPFSINYFFTTKDGINFKVLFHKKQGYYEREYFTTNRQKFGDLNTTDIYGILGTVTQITIDFINRYSPKEIVIYHIPSEKEREERRQGNQKITTKRALLNKRFLENKMPDGYKYELKDSTSYIRRK